jgi:hypothetical protein
VDALKVSKSRDPELDKSAELSVGAADTTQQNNMNKD